ncbi:DUF2147 domain-containing protein [Alterinioella nitratireducens]|uniref:DUF2147 domain-containing protein n=1 Tax=Alterinioella nitratireducens TaxID=2735915 RepID=UPI0015551BD3|nr:DUF2147 domain-containing protein [Alterinioella nitratireducens]NPD21054.1 DUF2147 domain-containing protein [Alterinioella nitratireducens]
MKKALLGAALLIGLAGMAAADPLEGTWRTAPNENGNSGLIVVAPCGGQLCGTLTTAYDASGNEMSSPDVGRQIIWETEPQGGGEYRGRIYDPANGTTYNSRLQLNGDTLSVSGCAFFVCRNAGTWTRQ